jgi:hypothetical protein
MRNKQPLLPVRAPVPVYIPSPPHEWEYEVNAKPGEQMSWDEICVTFKPWLERLCALLAANTHITVIRLKMWHDGNRVVKIDFPIRAVPGGPLLVTSDQVETPGQKR